MSTKRTAKILSDEFRVEASARGLARGQGFTLLEILLGVVILGLVAVVAIPVYRYMVQRSADTLNLADLKVLNQGLEIYKFKHPTSALLSGGNDAAQHTALLAAIQAMPESPFKQLSINPALIASTGAGVNFRFTAYATGAYSIVAGGGGGAEAGGSGTSLTTSDVVMNGLGFSQLAGAGSNALASRVTVGLSSGVRIIVGVAGQQSVYELVDSSGPQSLPTLVAPNDYAAGTNQRMWLQRFWDGTLRSSNYLSEFNGNAAAQAAVRGNLGLGSLSTQNAGAVAITGGTIALPNGAFTLGTQITSTATNLSLSGKMAADLTSFTSLVADGSTVGAGVTFAGSRNYTLMSTLATAPLGAGFLVLADATSGRYRWVVDAQGRNAWGGTTAYAPTAIGTFRGDGTNPIFDLQKADGSSAFSMASDGALRLGALAGTAGKLQVDTAGNLSVSAGGADEAPGEWVLVSTQFASDSPYIEFKDLSSAYSEYEIIMFDVQTTTASNAVLQLFGSSDNGSTLHADYTYGAVINGGQGYGVNTAAVYLGQLSLGGTSYGTVRIVGAGLVGTCFFQYSLNATGNPAGTWNHTIGSGQDNNPGGVNAVRLRYHSQNIKSGTFRLFARRTPGPPAGTEDLFLRRSGDIAHGDIGITSVSGSGPKLRLNATVSGVSGRTFDLKSTTASDSEGGGRFVVVENGTSFRLSLDDNGLTTRGKGGSIIRALSSAGATRLDVAEDGSATLSGRLTAGAIETAGEVKLPGVGVGVLSTNASGIVSAGSQAGPKLRAQEFNANGTFTPNAALLAAGGYVDVFLVGGGGGGGSSYGGGGGGGAVRQLRVRVTGPVTVTIGNGGSQDSPGQASGFGALTAGGGGAGGSEGAGGAGEGGGGGGGGINSSYPAGGGGGGAAGPGEPALFGVGGSASSAYYYRGGNGRFGGAGGQGGAAMNATGSGGNGGPGINGYGGGGGGYGGGSSYYGSGSHGGGSTYQSGAPNSGGGGGASASGGSGYCLVTWVE